MSAIYEWLGAYLPVHILTGWLTLSLSRSLNVSSKIRFVG